MSPRRWQRGVSVLAYNTVGDRMAYVRKEEEERTEAASTSSPEQSRRGKAEAADLANEEKVVALEDVVGKVLRWGSVLSMVIILAGLAGVVWYSRMTTGPQILLIPVVGTHDLNTPAALLSRIRNGDPTAIISVGLLVLILTPVLRVASTVVYFFLRRDRTYLAVTTFVLLVLIIGFLLGSTAG